MRIIACILLAVSLVTLVPVSGVAFVPASSGPDDQVITVLDICNQHSSGIFSGLDLPYVFECPGMLVAPRCLGSAYTVPSPSYVFIHHFEIDYPPKI